MAFKSNSKRWNTEWMEIQRWLVALYLFVLADVRSNSLLSLALSLPHHLSLPPTLSYLRQLLPRTKEDERFLLCANVTDKDNLYMYMRLRQSIHNRYRRHLLSIKFMPSGNRQRW